MNVLLLYPQYPETFWSFKHVLKYISKKAAFPPLGLLTIASMLPKDWHLKLIDVNVVNLTCSDLEWADMVFLSAMAVQNQSTQALIKQCKQAGKRIIMGGPAATSQPEMYPGIDHFILNEAEITLPEFLADFQTGTLKQMYRSEARADITRTPIPMWSLINFKDYASMAIQYSRGCPYNCDFCDIIVLLGRTPRTKTPTQLVAEIQSLYDAGWKNDVFIVDDNFIGNKQQVKQMLPELIRWQKAHKYPFKLFTEASTNLADDPELMRLMTAANFYKVFLGIESPNLDSLHECGKYQNANRNLETSVRTIQQNGFQVMGGFIIGFDSDHEGIFDAQIKFIQKVGIVTAMVGLLNALPHTRLWHRLKSENRLLHNPSGENTDGTINFIPKMDFDKLIAGYKRVLETIYSPKLYYQRINTFIKNYRPTVRQKVSRENLTAWFKSMWKIGVMSRSRFLYWTLMLKTLLRNFKAFPIAMELSIIGLHFEKITQSVVRFQPKARCGRA